MNRKRVHAGMVLWGILLFSSCKTDVLNPAQETSADGKVVLTVQAGLGGRSVLPQFFQTDITGYTLLGGKDSAAEEELVSFTTDGTTVAIETGTWDFTLNAYKGGAVILQGTITGRTITAVSTALAFSLAPLNDGAGSIEITITVPVGTGITQVVVYKDDLLLAAPLPDISLLGTEGKIVYTENAVASGEYRYRFELKDADDVTLGWVSETTLVRRNLTSKATIPLTAADLNEAISAGIVNTSAIGLEWTERTDAAEYRIYRTDNPSGTYTQIAAVPAGTTSYTDAGLSPGTWYYKISSYKNDGTTLHTLYKTVTLSAPAAGVPVPVINTAPATAGSVSLGWTAVSGAAYRIYRSGAVVGPYIQIGESAGTSYPDNGLSAGTTYYYQVSAVQGGDEGARSAAYSVKTLLSAPAEVSATATSAAGMTIAWQAVSGAAGYRVYYSTSAGGPYTSLNTNTAISSPYSVSSGLSAYTPYYYKVCAVDAGGTEGEASAVCTDTTYPAAPANVSAAAEPAGGIKITWTSISGLTYKVYRSASADGAYALVSAAAASPYTNTGLSSSATWYYKVAAVDSAGREGVQSTAASATTNTAVVIQINALQDVALSSSSQTLNKGANESKSFSAGGTFTGTDIQYQWYWDGEPISGATAAAYTVNAGSADRAIGVHQLTVVVTINSEIRSGRCRVTIQN